MPTIVFINNEGRGFAGEKYIPEGTTISKFLETEVRGNPNDYNIRVNKEPVVPSQVLQDGDRVTATQFDTTASRPTGELQEGDKVTVTPKKIAGATLELILDFLSDMRLAVSR